MKKFIRIENGVYELVDDKYIIKDNKLYEKEYFNNPFGDGSDEYIGEVLIGEIKAQADTIEELCDCFVPVGKRHIVWSKELIPTLTLEMVKNSYSIKFNLYGAIWTDKGLIYVAKLNDKGDLELI